MTENLRFLQELYDILKERKRSGDPDVSYSARLFARGTAKIAQKVGEEAVEIVIAAMQKDKKEVISESADLLYHLLALWVDRGVKPEEVIEQLKSRKGISGIDEKKARKKGK